MELYDFGARFYDPAIARWQVGDPLAQWQRCIRPEQIFNKRVNMTKKARIIRISCILGFLGLACLGVWMFLLYIMRGISEDGTHFFSSVEEARKMKMLVQAYNVPDRTYRVDDTTEIRLREAWIERRWCVAGWFNQDLRIRDGFALGVTWLPETYSLVDWQLTTSQRNSLSTGGPGGGFGRIDTIPAGDTLKLLLLKWDSTPGILEYRVKDTITLIKVK